MQFQEAQRLLQSSPDSEFERFDNGAAMAERIREWLETPEGTMAHHPAWGHNLTPFKFDPLSKNNGLAVQIEMSVAFKMPLDIEDLQLKGVAVEALDMDLVRIAILHQFGDMVEEIRL